mgnify:CR=1 FL=1
MNMVLTPKGSTRQLADPSLWVRINGELEACAYNPLCFTASDNVHQKVCLAPR